MPVLYEERQALGSRVQLTLVGGDGPGLAELMRQLWLEVLVFEKRCSRFLPDSELSQFNRAAGNRMPVSHEFRDALLAARRMAQATDGLYNPFILPALQRAGYVRSLVAGYEDDASDDHSDKRVVAAERLEIGDTWASIPYGAAIDLGGCGKGYIGDYLSGIAQTHGGLGGYWFSIGGDVISYGADEAGQPWVIYLQPDPKGGERIGEARATDLVRPFAVATSTTRFRRGQRRGKDWHHIIDPRSGRAAESDVDLVTVCASSLLEADVLASCGIIVGEAEIRQLMSAQNVHGAAWASSGHSGMQVYGRGILAYAA